MGVSSRTLEITVISGENIHVKEESYVVVRAESLKCCTTKAAKNTNIIINNNNSSSLISWNEKLLLEIPMHARSITFEVQCKNSRASSGRSVGVARIALSDILFGGSGCSGDGHNDNGNVLSYRLRDWDGRRNGVIHFSVRWAAPSLVENMVKPPVKELVEDQKKTKKESGEVVLGVPVWWNYPNII